ncbi:MAG: phosphoribosylglycinamide formyltransferase [Burkholderiales bacterium]|nr:phosphoribosylglycinamide formyltransferase [Burkholderiales bacterium]
MKSIVILISGRGSNLRSLVQACAAQAWPARIAAVVSNRPDAAGLEFARECGIATRIVNHREFATREAFDAALAETIASYAPDILALAGFMRILGADFVRRFAGRIVNIHPSLLPAFTGLHTHQRALQAGCKVAGATVHFVTHEVDHGPIIAQAVVPVLPDDTEETLAQRVLAREHLIYPMALAWLVRDALYIENGSVRVATGEAQWLL